MAFTAANMRFVDVLVRFFAVGVDLNLGFANQKRAVDFPLQNHVFATVGHQDIGHRAGIAQIRFPGLGGIAIL